MTRVHRVSGDMERTKGSKIREFSHPPTQRRKGQKGGKTMRRKGLKRKPSKRPARSRDASSSLPHLFSSVEKTRNRNIGGTGWSKRNGWSWETVRRKWLCWLIEADVCRCQQNFLWNLSLTRVSRRIFHVNGGKRLQPRRHALTSKKKKGWHQQDDLSSHTVRPLTWPVLSAGAHSRLAVCAQKETHAKLFLSRFRLKQESLIHCYVSKRVSLHSLV